MREMMARIVSQPMMAEESWLEATIAGIMGGPEATYFAGRWDPKNRINVTDDGIGIVHVSGLLVSRGPWLGSIWGMCSYEGLGEQFKRLAADDSIKHVVLDIDSGGGMVAGIWDLMPQLAALREQKPVTAIANPFCCSSAYAIGCAADRLVVNRSSTTGSIGVIRPHMDMTAALEKWGYKVTMFKAGRYKDAGSGMRPLDEEARAYIQADVDDAYAKFVDHVAAHRPLDQAAVRATEARVYCPEDACAAGLADGVASFDELLDQIRVPRRASVARKQPTPPGGSMSNTQGAALSAADLERLSASLANMVAKPAQASAPAADTVSRAEAERMAADAASAASAKARKDERDRISAITSCEAAHGRAAAALKMALTTDLTAEQAAGLLADLPKAEAKADSAPNPLFAAMRQPGTSAGVRPDGAAPTGAAEEKPSLAASFASRHAKKKVG